MKILVTGSRGLIGSALVSQLTGAGHYVVRLVRENPDRERGDLFWDPVSAKIERSKLEKLDAVVHLCGESILGRWTDARKERIYKSRVGSTEFLVQTLAGLTNKPKVLVSASGVGFYGSRGDEWLQETSPAGTGYLATLCQEWENATNTAANAGIRVVRARLGMVLTPKGGALKTMAGPFRMGLGGKLGSGRQFVSWISITDLVQAFQFAIENEDVSGPVNFVAPEPVTNRDFTRTLAATLGRPALLPAPAFALKAVFGEMATETMLASQRCQPARLAQNGFKFEYPDIDQALRHLLVGGL